MSTNSQHMVPQPSYEPEGRPPVDLLALLRSCRRSGLRFTAVVALLAAAAAAAAIALPPKERSVTLSLTPTFVGAGAGHYPNRAPFSPQDIVSSSVIEPIWRAQGLEESMTLADLGRCIQVVQGGREAALLRAEFEQKLSNSKLTAPERAALELEFGARLKAATSSVLTISVTMPGSALSDDQLRHFAAAIPVEWARTAVADRVTSYGFPIPSPGELRAFVNRELATPSASGTVLVAERLRRCIDDLIDSAGAASRLPGSMTLRDAGGASVTDLSRELDAIRRNVLVPECIEALAAARTMDPMAYAAMRQARVQILGAELHAARQGGEALRDGVRMLAVGEPSRSTAGGATRVSAPDDRGLQANVDASFLDRLVDQAVKGRDVEYRRDLTSRIVDSDVAVARLTAALEFEEWLDAEVARRPQAGRSVEAVSAGLAALADRLGVLCERAEALVDALARRNLNPASVLFTIDSPPAVSQVRTVELRSVALWSVAAWFAGMSAVVAMAVLRARAAERPVALLGEVQVTASHHVAGAVASIGDRRDPGSARRLPQGTREPAG